MATNLRDWHVVVLDEDGDPINVGNPLHVTATFSGTGSFVPKPATSGGWLIHRTLDTGTTGQVAKGSAGQLYGYYFSNQHASSWRYLKFYNKATAPTNADIPVATLPLPPDSAGHVPWPQGIAFSTGIGYRATTGIADADNTAPGSNEVTVNVFYF